MSFTDKLGILFSTNKKQIAHTTIFISKNKQKNTPLHYINSFIAVIEFIFFLNQNIRNNH